MQVLLEGIKLASSQGYRQTIPIGERDHSMLRSFLSNSLAKKPSLFLAIAKASQQVALECMAAAPPEPHALRGKALVDRLAASSRNLSQPLPCSLCHLRPHLVLQPGSWQLSWDRWSLCPLSASGACIQAYFAEALLLSGVSSHRRLGPAGFPGSVVCVSNWSVAVSRAPQHSPDSSTCAHSEELHGCLSPRLGRTCRLPQCVRLLVKKLVHSKRLAQEVALQCLRSNISQKAKRFAFSQTIQLCVLHQERRGAVKT